MLPLKFFFSTSTVLNHGIHHGVSLYPATTELGPLLFHLTNEEMKLGEEVLGLAPAGSFNDTKPDPKLSTTIPFPLFISTSFTSVYVSF